MNNEDNNNDKNNHIINFGDKVKKVNLEIQLDLDKEKSDKCMKLPSIITKKILPVAQKRKKLRKKLVQLESFCQSIYTNSNTTLNNTKTMGDVLNKSKLKAIEEIKNDYFINQIQVNKEENNCINNINNNIYRKLILNKSKPKNILKIVDNNNNNKTNEEKFTYLTTTYERKPVKDNLKFSVDNKRKIIYNYGDYASNKLIINHPKLYVLNTKRENTIDKLPLINKRYKKLNVVEEFSKLIPDNTILTREEKIAKYDEYMRVKELKEMNNA